MMDRRLTARAGALALIAATALVLEPSLAGAQTAPPPPTAPPAPPGPLPPPQPYAAPAPQAAPQPGYGSNGWAYQQDYQNYRQQYAAWADRNCITQHSNNIAAGAIVGGVAGALLAGSIAGWAARGAWILFGGSLGLAAGAAVGASSSAPGCPSGYAVRRDAPPFYYSGPAYAPAPYYPAYAQSYPAYAPSYPAYAPATGYRPYGGWTWDGYRWVRRPYPYYRPAPYAYGPY